MKCGQRIRRAASTFGVTLLLVAAAVLVRAGTAAAAELDSWNTNSCGHTRGATAAEAAQYGVPEGTTGVASAVLFAPETDVEYFDPSCAPKGLAAGTSGYKIVNCGSNTNCFWFTGPQFTWRFVALVHEVGGVGTPGGSGGTGGNPGNGANPGRPGAGPDCNGDGTRS